MAKVTSLIQINIGLLFSFEWNIKKWRRRRRRKRSEFGFSGRITSVESTLSPLFPVSLWILHQLPSQGREARSPSTLSRRFHLSPSFPRFDDIESSCWKYNRIVRLLANWDKPPISDSREGKQIFHSLRSTLRSISDPAMETRLDRTAPHGIRAFFARINFPWRGVETNAHSGSPVGRDPGGITSRLTEIRLSKFSIIGSRLWHWPSSKPRVWNVHVVKCSACWTNRYTERGFENASLFDFRSFVYRLFPLLINGSHDVVA